MKTFRLAVGMAVVGLGFLMASPARGQSIRPPPPPTVIEAPIKPPSPRQSPPRFRILQDFASNPDQQGIAGQLDAMGREPNADLLGVLDELTRIPPDQVGPALDQISPASYDADTDAALSAGHRHIEMVSGFLEDSAASSGENDSRWSPWVGGIKGTDEGRNNSSARTLGSAGGMDYRFGKNIRFGFQFGYSHSDVTYSDSSSKGKIDLVNYGSYALWAPSHGYIEAIVNMTDQSFDDQRQISFGEVNRLALAKYDGRGRSAYLGTGYDFTLAGCRLRPTAAMEYGRFQRDGFTEDGAGSLNLAVDGSTEDSVQSHVGVRMDYELKFLLVTVTPRATVSWGHQFETAPRELEARFEQSGTEPFTVHGEAGNADGLETSAGLAAKIFGVSAFMDYGVTFAGGAEAARTLKAGLWTMF